MSEKVKHDSGESDSDFRFWHSVPVRFRDVDVAGHVHHADALIYFEEARWAYWEHVVGDSQTAELPYVLAECSVRWHSRVFWPQTVSVGVRVSRIGRKHFEFQYEVRGETGDKLQSGSTVQVMYDYSAGASSLMPVDLRRTLESFDGPLE